MVVGESLNKSLEELNIQYPTFINKNITDKDPNSNNNNTNLYSKELSFSIAVFFSIFLRQVNNLNNYEYRKLCEILLYFRKSEDLSCLDQILLILIEENFYSIPNDFDSKFKKIFSLSNRNLSLLIGLCIFCLKNKNFLIGLEILEYLIKEEKYKPNLKISFIHDINFALESVKFFDNDQVSLLNEQKLALNKLFCAVLKKISFKQTNISDDKDEFMKINFQIIESRKYISGKDFREYISLLVKTKKYLLAVEKFKEYENFSKDFGENLSLKDYLLEKIYHTFFPRFTAESPNNYPEINKLIEKSKHNENFYEPLKSISYLEEANPFIVINNFSEKLKLLDEENFWIVNGNVRSGSTLIFNLLRILANSLTTNNFSAWEGDLKSPQKFFQIVEENNNLKLGLLKIHKYDKYVESKLFSHSAKAILTHRNLLDASLSYWRMVNTINSPFFISNPSFGILDQFIRNEINSFLLKNKSPNTLTIKEMEISNNLNKVITKTCNFLNISIENSSLNLLTEFLSKKNMGNLSSNKKLTKNLTGHQKITFLHSQHISNETYTEIKYSKVRDYIIDLLTNKYSKSLSSDFYITL